MVRKRVKHRRSRKRKEKREGRGRLSAPNRGQTRLTDLLSSDTEEKQKTEVRGEVKEREKMEENIVERLLPNIKERYLIGKTRLVKNRLKKFIPYYEEVGGLCGEASYSLAYLVNGKLVFGSFMLDDEEIPHYWVEKNGYILDATSPTESNKIIVTKKGDERYNYNPNVVDPFIIENKEVKNRVRKRWTPLSINDKIIEKIITEDTKEWETIKNKDTLPIEKIKLV